MIEKGIMGGLRIKSIHTTEGFSLGSGVFGSSGYYTPVIIALTEDGESYRYTKDLNTHEDKYVWEKITESEF